MDSPRLSIVTFSNDPDYVYTLCKFLTQNEFPSSWEWVIGHLTELKSSALWERVSTSIQSIPNIRLFKIPALANTNIGSYKQYCAETAKGEYLVFFDQDVIPSSETKKRLEVIVTEADFIYGDIGYHVAYTPSDMTDVFTMPVLNCRSLIQADQAPQGMQMWKTSTFRDLGGFNTAMPAACEYELVCRGYLKGIKTQYIPTVLSLVPAIAWTDERKELSVNVSSRYFYSLVYQDTKRNILPVYDLTIPGQETAKKHLPLVWDEGALRLTFGGAQPEQANAGIIRASDFLNYVPQNQVISLISEIWRLLAPDGWFISSTPSTQGIGAFADPRQASYWNQYSFRYFCLEQGVDEQFKGLFQHTRVWESYPTDWHKENNMPYVNADLFKLSYNK